MMKKFFEHKIWAVLAACLAVLMLVFLAAGLGNIQFQPGRPLAQGDSSTIQISFEKIAEEIASIPLWKQAAVWLMAFLLVVIIAFMFPPDWRKKILKFFLRYSLFVLALFYIIKNFRSSLFPELNLGNANGQLAGPQSAADIASMTFTPPEIPSTILYLISLGALLALAGIGFLIRRWWMNKKLFQKNPLSMAGLADIARSSLADISAGRNLEDAIIKCYTRMNEVVITQRGLHRRIDLTPSEFAVRLEQAGLPGNEVRRLTRLFEAARYGTGHASRKETIEAVACLTAVMHACGVE